MLCWPLLDTLLDLSLVPDLLRRNDFNLLQTLGASALYPPSPSSLLLTEQTNDETMKLELTKFNLMVLFTEDIK